MSINSQVWQAATVATHIGRLAALLLLLLAALAPGSAAAPYALRSGDDLVGVLVSYRTAPGDSLPAIARQRGLGLVALVAANPHVDPWQPATDSKLLLPTRFVLPGAPRDGIVINLAEMRLYFFPPDASQVEVYPVGIGREGWDTPIGNATVLRKAERPRWFPPDSIRAEQPSLPEMVPPGPNNPLGGHAIYLDWPGYLIHGTNRPSGVGRRISHGCLRMYAADIAALFQRVDVGTSVTVLQQQAKLGWSGGALYLEVHPRPAAADRLAAGEALPPLTDWELADIVAATRRAAGTAADRLDMGRTWQAARERRGVPVRVTRRLP